MNRRRRSDYVVVGHPDDISDCFTCPETMMPDHDCVGGDDEKDPTTASSGDFTLGRPGTGAARSATTEGPGEGGAEEEEDREGTDAAPPAPRPKHLSHHPKKNANLTTNETFANRKGGGVHTIESVFTWVVDDDVSPVIYGAGQSYHGGPAAANNHASSALFAGGGASSSSIVGSVMTANRSVASGGLPGGPASSLGHGAAGIGVSSHAASIMSIMGGGGPPLMMGSSMNNASAPTSDARGAATPAGKHLAAAAAASPPSTSAASLSPPASASPPVSAGSRSPRAMQHLAAARAHDSCNATPSGASPTSRHNAHASPVFRMSASGHASSTSGTSPVGLVCVPVGRLPSGASSPSSSRASPGAVAASAGPPSLSTRGAVLVPATMLPSDNSCPSAVSSLLPAPPHNPETSHNSSNRLGGNSQSQWDADSSSSDFGEGSVGRGGGLAGASSRRRSSSCPCTPNAEAPLIPAAGRAMMMALGAACAGADGEGESEDPAGGDDNDFFAASVADDVVMRRMMELSAAADPRAAGVHVHLSTTTISSVAGYSVTALPTAGSISSEGGNSSGGCLVARCGADADKGTSLQRSPSAYASPISASSLLLGGAGRTMADAPPLSPRAAAVLLVSPAQQHRNPLALLPPLTSGPRPTLPGF